MLMHFAALCFHFPPLCLPESRARHTRPSQGEGRAAREDEETDKWGGKEEEKTTGQTSEQATTKAFFVCNKKRSNLPFFFYYLNFFFIILAGEEDEERGLREWGKRQSGKSEKEREIGGEAARRGTGAREAGGKRNQ